MDLYPKDLTTTFKVMRTVEIKKTKTDKQKCEKEKGNNAKKDFIFPLLSYFKSYKATTAAFGQQQFIPSEDVKSKNYVSKLLLQRVHEMERIGQPTFKKLFCLSLFFLFRQIILLAS